MGDFIRSLLAECQTLYLNTFEKNDVFCPEQAAILSFLAILDDAVDRNDPEERKRLLNTAANNILIFRDDQPYVIQYMRSSIPEESARLVLIRLTTVFQYLSEVLYIIAGGRVHISESDSDHEMFVQMIVWFSTVFSFDCYFQDAPHVYNDE